jgi:hypothetical protein
MQHHYSTVDAGGVRAGLAEVIDIAGVRQAIENKKAPGGASAPKTKMASESR